MYCTTICLEFWNAGVGLQHCFLGLPSSVFIAIKRSLPDSMGSKVKLDLLLLFFNSYFYFIGMILQGISYDKILDQVRESAGASRAALLERKDIENIFSQFGLNQEQMHLKTALAYVCL